ncbi:MAG: guanylate kinase [Armatimonadetes bacterium]|nr:guanylate kinase [Armatimonadota bacterium]
MSEVVRGTMLVICGPSGAGKTTLIDSLRAADPGLHFSVSWTTRAPRDGELDGVDYHFVSRAQFAAEADGEHGMLEWASVHQNDYGTPRGQVLPYLRDGVDVVLDIDVQGAEQVRGSGLPAVFVFILPPSLAELERRLRQRESETPESLARRLARSTAELAQWPMFDYAVVNDDRERAATELLAIRRAAPCLVVPGRAPRGWQDALPTV